MLISGALLSTLTPSMGISTSVIVDEGDKDQVLIGQSIHTLGSQSAQLTFLTPEEALDSSSLLPLLEPLRRFAEQRAIWGTCAGAIFISKDAHRQQPLLRIMDIRVERNAFGRQVASFEVDLDVPALRQVDPDGRPYHAVFIRAPLIESVYGDAQILARLDDGRIVAAQQGRMLATSFHPELTADDRFHRYFLHLVGTTVGLSQS